MKTTGRIALYCPASDVLDAKRTFLSALHSSDSFEHILEEKVDQLPKLNKTEKITKFKTLPGQISSDQHSKSFSNEYKSNALPKNSQIRSNSGTVFAQPHFPPYPSGKTRQRSLSDEEMDDNFEERMTRPGAERPRQAYSEHFNVPIAV